MTVIYIQLVVSIILLWRSCTTLRRKQDNYVFTRFEEDRPTVLWKLLIIGSTLSILYSVIIIITYLILS